MANLKCLFDFYKKGVEEGNEKSFGDLYKAALQYFFEQINAETHSWCNPCTFNFINIEYDDGYFIFGRGDNMVDRFHIKEIPGWLFGVWFREPDKMKDGRLSIKFDVFWQYEDTIDKFKPSKSEFCFTPEIVWSGDKFDYMTKIMRITNSLMFTHNEPCLAFCRDYCGWDYNEKYHTRIEAKKEYNKYIKNRRVEEKLTTILDKIMLNKVKKLFVDKFESSNAYIRDRGENWSPRYDLIINVDGLDKEPDTYRFDDDIYSKFNKTKKRCEKIAKRHNICWFSPIDAFMDVVEPDEFKQIRGKK